MIHGKEKGEETGNYVPRVAEKARRGTSDPSKALLDFHSIFGNEISHGPRINLERIARRCPPVFRYYVNGRNDHVDAPAFSWQPISISPGARSVINESRSAGR